MRKILFVTVLVFFSFVPSFSQQIRFPAFSRESFNAIVSNGRVNVILPSDVASLSVDDVFFVYLEILEVLPARRRGIDLCAVEARAMDGETYIFLISPEYLQSMRLYYNTKGLYFGIRVRDEFYGSLLMSTSSLPLPNLARGLLMAIVDE